MAKQTTNPKGTNPIDVNLLVQKLEALEPTVTAKERRTSISLIFDTLESRLAAGVSQADIVRALNETGMNITTNQLRKDLHHIRQEKGISIKARKSITTTEKSKPENINGSSRDQPLAMTRPANPREAIRNARNTEIDLDRFSKLNSKKD